jgi:hypothetical protein
MNSPRQRARDGVSASDCSNDEKKEIVVVREKQRCCQVIESGRLAQIHSNEVQILE